MGRVAHWYTSSPLVLGVRRTASRSCTFVWLGRGAKAAQFLTRLLACARLHGFLRCAFVTASTLGLDAWVVMGSMRVCVLLKNVWGWLQCHTARQCQHGCNVVCIAVSASDKCCHSTNGQRAFA
jgi:hypothetical protein